MSRYVDAERLIKLVNSYQEGAIAALKLICGYDGYYGGKIHACRDIQDFITDLLHEQPEVDLENEAVNFCSISGVNISPIQAKNIARHFYELGLKARKEE